MPSPYESYALMKGGRIYTLQKLTDKECPTYKHGFRWRAYCDGSPCGFFKKKKDFEAFVAREPEPPPLAPHAQHTLRALTWSQYEGRQILQRLDESQNRRPHDPTV